MTTDSNSGTIYGNSVRISGIAIVPPPRPPKHILSIKVLIDGKKFGIHRFEEHLQDGDTPLRWDFIPPLTLQSGCSLGLQLRMKRKFAPFSTLLAEASISSSDALHLLFEVPFGEQKGYKLKDFSITIASGLSVHGITLTTIEKSRKSKKVLDHLSKSRRFLEMLLEFGSVASELHPIAKAVFTSVNKVYQKLKDHDAINNDILDLVENIACAVCYLEDVKQFARLVQLKEAIEDACPLVEDIANLVLQLAAQSEVNTLCTLIPSSDRDKINELSKRFNRFRQQFDRGIAIQSSATLELLRTLQFSEKEERLLTELRPLHLEDLPPIAGCMPKTREDILADIHEWVENLDSMPNILWLTGFPGVGKSTVTSTLVENLRASYRLGSSFFFNRANATITTPTALWRKVAFDLTRLYPTARMIVTDHLDGGIVSIGTASAEALFLQLIKPVLESIVDIPSGRFPVVVVDALDECGGLDGPRSDHRKGLLKTLKSWSHLPPQFKLVVTSRDEDDLKRTLGSISYQMELTSGRKASLQSSHDIHLFLQTRFKEVAEPFSSLPEGWPGPIVLKELTTRAAGLFIWAETVMKLVEEGDPLEQLNRIQEGDLGDGDMMALYRLILVISFKNPSSKVVDSFASLVGAIIVAKIPLHPQDYTSLLSIESSMMEFICKGLRSVMEIGEVLQFRHQSFVDFLLNHKGCPKNFLIDEKKHTHLMLTSCVKVMQNELHFNICGLETSHVSNDEAPNCHAISRNPIPTHLMYCCQYWVDHLIATSFDMDIIKHIRTFMDNKLLYWLEVLSVIKKVNVAREALLYIAKWCKSLDNDTAALASDAAKFVTVFGGIISHSIPHLYLSALPFAPIMSKVSMEFLHHFPQTLSIKTGKSTEWPAIQYVINTHEAINSATFSPDGTCIASGSHDKTIHVWDVISGGIIAGPFIGHTGRVTSISFSPDGTHIVSGSDDKAIHVWDVAGGDMITRPFTGHTGCIRSVAFSPDGTYIVSGSDDQTIRVWNAANGEIITRPFIGHTERVRSVKFSPDGTCIVSGSDDKTACIWNAASGEVIAGPFKGHTDCVTSVSFSPDGTQIVSGSADKTICVWDAVSGDIIAGPLIGHVDQVTSVAFSPDGTCIVSGSADKTICIWNTESGGIIAGPLQGHSGWVTSVSFSTDGTHIISGSWDQNIHVWDAANGDIIARPFIEHTDRVRSVAFSPDGTCIVSGSDDKTICVWDVASGEIIAGPLQGHTGWVTSVSFSPDGTCIVSGSADKTICIWDAVSGDAIGRPLQGHTTSVTSVAFSQDGTHIVSGSLDKTIHVWDIASGDIIAGPLKGHTGWVTSVSFSPDGTHIVSGSADKTICVWDVASGKIIAGPFKGHTDWVTSVSFSPDGAHIASGSHDCTICVWDAASGDIITGPLTEHTNFVNSIAFSPDGTHIVSGSDDKNICVWDVTGGNLIARPFTGHLDHINSVSFSPDGTHIVSGSDDKTIRVWDIGDLIAKQIQYPSLSGNHNDAQSGSSETPSIRGRNNSHDNFNILNDNSNLQNGWLFGPDNELLFWIPPWTTLWRPRNTMVISNQKVTCLDFSNFVHGTQWQYCHTSNPSN